MNSGTVYQAYSYSVTVLSDMIVIIELIQAYKHLSCWAGMLNKDFFLWPY